MNEIFYWKWDRVVPSSVCEALIKELSTFEFNVGTVGHASNTVKSDEIIRNGKTAFLPEAHWFEGILINYVSCANQNAKWNFDITGNEDVQIASYCTDEQYDWHTDELLLQKNTSVHRKLTVVCQLSKAEDFSGGGLFLGGSEVSVLQNQGDVIVFPSFLSHKAATVTSGRRMTAVCWATGPYFK